METTESKKPSETFTIAVHESPQGVVLVITDSDLIGKKFETEKLQLDLTKKFYIGEEMPASDDLKEKIEGSNSVHVTGKKAVNYVKSIGFINEGKVLEIAGIPHAEIYLGA